MNTPIAVQRMLHSIHAVNDVPRARQLYQDVLGAIAFAERYHAAEDRDMALFYVADHMIEPMAPRRPAEPDTTLARYIHRFGEGLHSFELRIADIPAAAAACAARGLALSKVYPTFFFVKPQSTGGVLVELCGKPMDNDPKDYRGWRPDWIEGHPSGLRRLHHIACVVRDLDQALAFFTEVIDGQVVDDRRISAPQPARQVRLLFTDIHIALIAPDDRASGPLSEYLAGPASGMFALVWEVADLCATRVHMERKNIPVGPGVLHPEGLAIDPAAMMGARHEFFSPA